MKKIEIYDPAMCCSTGVCGPSVDTELLRVATVVDNLKKQGVDISRHNLASEPQDFVSNKTINDLLMQDNDILPVTLVDGEVVKSKAHLTNEEFTKYTGIMIVTMPQAAESSCGCGSSEQAEETACCSGASETENEAPCCAAGSDCC